MNISIRRRIVACKAVVTRRTKAHGYVADQVRDVVGAALLVRNTWLQWGPTDDGSPEGESFERALDNLNKQLRRFGF